MVNDKGSQSRGSAVQIGSGITQKEYVIESGLDVGPGGSFIDLLIALHKEAVEILSNYPEVPSFVGPIMVYKDDFGRVHWREVPKKHWKACWFSESSANFPIKTVEIAQWFRDILVRAIPSEEDTSAFYDWWEQSAQEYTNQTSSIALVKSVQENDFSYIEPDSLEGSALRAIDLVLNISKRLALLYQARETKKVDHIIFLATQSLPSLSLKLGELLTESELKHFWERYALIGQRVQKDNDESRSKAARRGRAMREYLNRLYSDDPTQKYEWMIAKVQEEFGVSYSTAKRHCKNPRRASKS